MFIRNGRTFFGYFKSKMGLDNINGFVQFKGEKVKERW